VEADRKTRILVADGDEAVRRGILMLVRDQEGMQIVAQAANGPDALKAAAGTRPDIAILEQSLAGMNGHDLASRLRLLVPGIAVIIFTMNLRRQMVVDAIQAGASAVVLKTDPGDALASALSAVAGGRTYLSDSIAHLLGDAAPPAAGARA
jgi:DNA-binding NarL/FixJ family response regulator